MVSLGPAGESQSQWLVSGDSQEGLVIMEEETEMDREPAPQGRGEWRSRCEFWKHVSCHPNTVKELGVITKIAGKSRHSSPKLLQSPRIQFLRGYLVNTVGLVNWP